MNVNADNRTTGVSGDSQRRSPCSTTNIEQCGPRRKLEPLQKPVLLVCGEPAILSNILAKSFVTDLPVQLRLKTSVVGVVVTSGRKRVFAHLGLRQTGLKALFL